jgi:predicted nucleic acid-binding protein
LIAAMAFLLDSSVLVRLVNTADPQSAIAQRAITVLEAADEMLCLTPQNLIEFRNVATRPVTVNGLGYSPATVELYAARFETRYILLDEMAAIYPTWKRIVQAVGVIGKQVHDARLVAVCHVYGLSHILTFNVRDFQRFTTLPPGLAVVDPRTV